MQNQAITAEAVNVDNAKVITGIQLPLTPFERFLIKPLPPIKLYEVDTVMVGKPEDAHKEAQEAIDSVAMKRVAENNAYWRVGVILAIPSRQAIQEAYSNFKVGDTVVFKHSTNFDLFKDSVVCYAGDILGHWVGQVPEKINKVSEEDEKQASLDEPKIKAWFDARNEAQTARRSRLNQNYPTENCNSLSNDAS